MTWTNGPARFGRITRALHWTTAVLVLGQLGLGFWTARMAPGLGNLWLYGLHKSLGVLVLALVVLRLAWHRISPPPRPLGPPEAWDVRAARAVHRAFYALLVVQPLAGWAGSSATGIDVAVFGGLMLPPIAPVSQAWEAAAFALHAALGWVLVALALLHVAGALRRAAAGDGTLRRMLHGG